MFVNDLILNASVKMTEMFISEKILASSGSKIYFKMYVVFLISCSFQLYRGGLVILVEETRIHQENHRPVANH
jgi:hypothetical protein